MSKTIDAKGLACPEPVVLARKALSESPDITVIVDNETARENIKRMARSQSCSFQEHGENGEYHIHITRDNAAASPGSSLNGRTTSGPDVYVFSENRMGHGDDELGSVLIRAFIHTLLDIENGPDSMLFYNSGVFLTMADSPVLDDLRELAERGTEILVCGTCVNFFKLDKPSAGMISNMYEIAGRMSLAGRIVKP